MPLRHTIRLLNRLRLSAKFALLGLIGAIPLAVLLVLVMREISADLSFARAERAGARLIAPMARLLDAAQGERPATGSDDAQLSSHMRAIEQLARQSSVDLGEPWSLLAGAAGNAQARDNGVVIPSNTRQAALTQTVLRLMRQVADSSKLTLDPELDTFYQQNVSVRTLPVALERVASTHALALESARSKQLPAEQRAQLSAGLRELHNGLAEIDDELSRAGASNPRFATEVQPLRAAFAQGITNFAALLERSFARTEQIEIAPATVANSGSAARTAGYKLLFATAQALERSLDERVGALQRKRMAIAVMAGVAGALLMYLLLAMLHGLRGSFASLQNGLSKVAQGDLTHSVLLDARDETLLMAQHANAMVQQLRALVAAVNASASAVRLSSHDLGDTSSELASRTEQQSSSLEETSASMEEFSASITATAQNARSADQYARQAAEHAQRGGDAMRRVVERIREAHHESQRTQEVIGIIESFAFQTNILALNAAVEAARAGEQGRGFAVVAAEVRNLARRSAQATHEIKQLLSNSLLNSKASLDIVEDTGAQIEAVVSSVRQTTETMRDIASACAEQASSIAQVTAAISQMDRITQLNAALVQRHVAAAQTLDQQAAQLSTAVSRFTTDDQPTPQLPTLYSR